MGFRKEIYEKANLILTQRKQAAEEKALSNKYRFYDVCERGERIERELSSIALKAARSVMGGKNVKEELETLKNRSLALQNERKELLMKNGFTTDFLEVKYTCPKCKDTGYIDGKICSCLLGILKQEAYKELNAASPLSLSTFKDFSLDYYSGEEKAKMSTVLEYCKRYASSFSLSSKSIVMLGGTGLGKTHLSLAIASEAIEKGFGVVYGTIQSFARKFESERFKDLEESTFSTLLDCDLLILDDLGTEISSSYIAASIYEIIDTRLMKNLPTIISTNLETKEMQTRYSERLVSRLFGNFYILNFVGKDMRLKRFK